MLLQWRCFDIGHRTFIDVLIYSQIFVSVLHLLVVREPVFQFPPILIPASIEIRLVEKFVNNLLFGISAIVIIVNCAGNLYFSLGCKANSDC